MKKPLLALFLILAMPLALGACGSDDDSGNDEDQVRDVIELVNNQDAEACEKLSDDYMKNVIGGDEADCKRQVKNTPKDAVKIENVKVDGDKATVTGDIQGRNGTISLVKEDGDWKLDDVKR